MAKIPTTAIIATVERGSLGEGVGVMCVVIGGAPLVQDGH